MTEKELLRILEKYGFHSWNKEPFLYVENEQCGIFYSIKHPFYGTLKRIILPRSSVEAELFIAKYYWYKKQEKKIQVELSDYKITTPELKYYYENQELTLKDLENLAKNIQPTKKQNDKYSLKLKRTIHLLLGIIEAKIKNQQVTYQNLIQLSNERIKKENEYLQIYGQVTRTPSRTLAYIDETVPDQSESIKTWKEQILKVENNLEIVIQTLTDFIYQLEIDEGYLKNKYELIKIPLVIDVLKTKIGFLQNPDSKKVDLERALQTIDEKSTLKKIVTYEQYKMNEEKRLQEKYSMIPDIDLRTLGDFFMEFDNIKLPEPILVEKVAVENKMAFESVISSLEKSFENRSKEEQDYLIFIEYILKNIFRENKAELDENLEELIHMLNNPVNVMIRIKFFKNIKTSSIEDCYQSIQEEIKRHTLKYDSLIGDINVFWKDKKIVTANHYIKASSKRLFSPIQDSGENDVSYLATLKKNVALYFIPKALAYDINNDDTFVLQDKPMFLINMHQNHLIQDSSNILKVVDYQEEKNAIGKLTIVTNLQSKKINLFRKVIIERNEE